MAFAKRSSLLGLVMMLWAVPAWADGADAGNSDAASSAATQETSGTSQEPAPTRGGPDTSPLAGAQEGSVGSVGRAHNYFLPSLHIAEAADSNFHLVSGPGHFEAASILVGRVAMEHVTRTTAVTADYLGGGYILDRNTDLSSTMHQFGISGHVIGRHWAWELDDRAIYVPESPLGFGGFGFLGGPGFSVAGAYGSNLGNINPALSPSQSIVTGRGSREANTVVTEIEYAPNARSQFTVGGAFGILRFRTAGYVESNNGTAFAGYNRVVTAKDRVGVSYGVVLFRFGSSPIRFQGHFAQLLYERRITGRMVFQAGAGPEYLIFSNPLAGSNTRVAWNARATLHYRAARTGLGVSYHHFAGTGGGILKGSETDWVQAGLSWRLSRNWSTSMQPGYAHNRSLRQTTGGTKSASFDSYFAGASLSRSLGRYMSLFFTYHLQSQHSNGVVCSGPACGRSVLRNLFGVGFDWHARQIEIE